MLLRLLPANLNLLTLLQDDRPVLRLILDIGVLVEIPNSAPCRGRHLLEVRERASELWPGVRMKFAHNFRSARENLFCTLQNTNFRPLRIDFYAPRSRQPVLRKITIESDRRHSNFVGLMGGRKLHARSGERGLRIAATTEQYRLPDFV